MKIIFLGSNPSSLNEDPTIPFVGSKSWPILKAWIKQMNLVQDDCHFFNCSDRVLDKGEKLTAADINRDTLHQLAYMLEAGDCKLIALGNFVHDILDAQAIEHFHLPHPSPLNRQLNDKNFVRVVLNECRFWIHKESSYNPINRSFLKAL